MGPGVEKLRSADDSDWLESVPVLNRFDQVADPSRYAPLPADWHVGVADVVDSTGAIEAGRYKAVNLAGAGVIGAVANALGGDLPLFVFGGDGARFAVRPDQAPDAARALASTAMWTSRDLRLRLRVGMMPVAGLREEGLDVRVAFWPASDSRHYAMFTGGGLEWAEAQLKRGAIGLPTASDWDEPDLAGLSCHWSPIPAARGRILSLIVKPAPGVPAARFAETVAQLVALLEKEGGASPVPANGPEMTWPPKSVALQSLISRRGQSVWRRRLRMAGAAVGIWLLFRLGRRIGRFDPARYRRQLAANSDFRKFDDGLMMTVDCTEETEGRLRAMLEAAAGAKLLRFGLHAQDKALMTCVVPSVLTPDHMHFIDGAGGGYAAAARQLVRQRPDRGRSDDQRAGDLS